MTDAEIADLKERVSRLERLAAQRNTAFEQEMRGAYQSLNARLDGIGLDVREIARMTLQFGERADRRFEQHESGINLIAQRIARNEELANQLLAQFEKLQNPPKTDH